MEQSPTWASELGDRRWNDRWEDSSDAASARRDEHARATLATLARIEKGDLSPADRLDARLFRRQLEEGLEERALDLDLLRIDQQGGLQNRDDLASALRFETVKDYDDWLARLAALPALVEQERTLLARGAAKGVIHSRQILSRVPAQLEKQVVDSPEKSPFFAPFKKFPADFPASERERIVAKARDLVQKWVVPAYAKFLAFVKDEYLPKAPEAVGIWQMPDGARKYAFCVRRHTTTNRTPREIHEIGLAEVARIRAELETLVKAEFPGKSWSEACQLLRSEPRFFARSGEELLARYRALAKRVDPELVRLFRTLPRMPYGVEPIPDAMAPDVTTAYYRGPAADGSRAGTYFVNLYKPETRPLWEMTALTLHESVPGHHLQIALAMEQGAVPEFRKHAGYTAFVEGWGLYAESLGEDMGLYEDRLQKIGQLTYEMWRAVRLVVDTGLHELRWDRQKAIDFFAANAAKSLLDITNEVDRYVAWPGQALAYKTGELELKALRARARRELGPAFDVRDFHDVVLSAGALPLDVLEARVDAWIQKEKARRYR